MVMMLVMMTMKTHLAALDEVDTVVFYVETNEVTAKNALLVIKRMQIMMRMITMPGEDFNPRVGMG